MKAAASGKKGKRPPWFPRFPKRHPISSAFGKNQKESFIIKREKELNKYLTQILTQMPDALFNVHMDRFMNLSLRVQGKKSLFKKKFIKYDYFFQILWKEKPTQRLKKDGKLKKKKQV